MAEGLDNRRLILISAVLEKFLKLNLAECDIFANLTGGLSADEPALDLALAVAVISSYKEIPVKKQTAFFGEVGLGGEIRPVARLTSRIKELTNTGFEHFIVPADSSVNGKNYTAVSNIRELLNDAFFDS